jgi:hypothetical protein
MKHCRPPLGLFKGRNFMTPNITGYYKLRHGYAELSRGEGIDRQPIYGVTVLPDPDSLGSRSKLFHSEQQARAYIEELS